MSAETSVAVEVEPEVYTTTEACQLSGVSVRQLWHWLSTRVIAPSAQRATGAGTNNLWTQEDLEVISLLGELARLGAPTGHLEHMVMDMRRVLRDRAPMRSPDIVVVTRDPINVIAGRLSQTAAMLAEFPASGYWVLDLRRLLPRPPG